MKTWATILFSFWLLFCGTAFTFKNHFCNGQFKGTSLKVTLAECSAKVDKGCCAVSLQSCCKAAKNNNKKCCDDQIKTMQLDLDWVNSNIQDFDFQTIQWAVAFVQSFYGQNIQPKIATYTKSANSPPLRWQHTPVQFQQFLL